MPLVSIVIPAYSRLALTQQCLDSLRTTVEASAEVIVVDNGSQDGTDAFLRSLGSSIRRIRNAANLGFAPACNQGARAAITS
ncbi:MAG: glycosyltransferase [Myxococcota bacterium]